MQRFWVDSCHKGSGKLEKLKEAFSKDRYDRHWKSMFRAFVAQMFGNTWFFDCWLCFGKVDDEMIRLCTDLCENKKQDSRPHGRAREAGRPKFERVSRGIKHQMSEGKRARQQAQNLRWQASEKERIYWEENRLVHGGWLQPWHRSIVWPDVRRAIEVAEHAERKADLDSELAGHPFKSPVTGEMVISPWSNMGLFGRVGPSCVA